MMADFGTYQLGISLLLDDKCQATNIRCATNFRVANMNHYLSVSRCCAEVSSLLLLKLSSDGFEQGSAIFDQNLH